MYPWERPGFVVDKTVLLREQQQWKCAKVSSKCDEHVAIQRFLDPCAAQRP